MPKGLPLITAITLKNIVPVSQDHPVYKVTIGAHDYVLKAETSAGQEASSDVKWASKLMHNVVDEKKSEDTKVRLLWEPEIDVIGTEYTRYFVNGPELIRIEETLGNPDSVWVLMHWQPNLFVTCDQMNGAKKQQLFNIINHGTFWKSLGKVIAVDLFTGNNDRFDFGIYNQVPQGQEELFWANKGNVFINVSNVGRSAPMGLDFFFAQNAFGKDLITDQAYIRAMSDKGEIRKIAELVIASMMKELTGYNLGVKSNKSSKKKSRFTTAIKRYETTYDKYLVYLTDSIWTGLHDIKQYLLSKRREYARQTPPPNFGNNLLRQAPQVPNRNPGNPATHVPVAHNNKPRDKGVFPQNLEDRMTALHWI